MCNSACIGFVEGWLAPAEVSGRRVIEVGSFDVNGSVRPSVERLGPASYLGVDIAEGPGVDLVCPAEELLGRFGPSSFDVVISTEMVEHVEDWRVVFHNLKQVTAPGGVILITTRSEGFPLHDHPGDFWRYELDDMRLIFSDMDVLALEPDSFDPGVFVKARRGDDFQENPLHGVALYSMISGERALSAAGARHTLEDRHTLADLEARMVESGLGRAEAEAGAEQAATALAQARDELERLHATKLFRYSAPLRKLYGLVRRPA